MVERIVSTRNHAESSETAEQTREQMNLRIQFAAAVARVTHQELPDVLYTYTDFYRRLGLGDPYQGAESGPEWQAYISAVRTGDDPLELTTNRVLERERTPRPEPERFGSFRYDYHEKTNAIGIHFGLISFSAENTLSHIPAVDQAKDDIRRLLLDAKQKYPDAKVVQGRSWLYTRLFESERLVTYIHELFPESFIASQQQKSGGYQGGARWGQFLQSGGRLNQRAKEFIENLKNITPETIDEAFPIQPTSLEAPIGDFYKKYEIE